MCACWNVSQKSSWLPLPELQSSGSLWPLPPVVFCLSLQGSQLGTPWVNRASGPSRSSHQLNRIQRKTCVLLQATPGLQDFQTCLGGPQTVTIPQPGDALWILTNDCEQQRHRSHTVCTPNDQLLLAEFFAVKLCKHQVTWLPFEIKALAIATAIKHIIKHVHVIQSSHPMVVLTVSSPCVHANEKLKREEFSTTSRATTFLSTVSHYFVYVLHIAGVENFPFDFGRQKPMRVLRV